MIIEGVNGRIISIQNDQVQKDWIQVVIFWQSGNVGNANGYEQKIVRFHKDEWKKILEFVGIVKE